MVGLWYGELGMACALQSRGFDSESPGGGGFPSWAALHHGERFARFILSSVDGRRDKET